MIDVIAGEPQFIDHTAPVYLALPEEMRGDFIVARSSTQVTKHGETLTKRAARRGVEAVTKPTDPKRPVLVTSYGDNIKARRQGRRRIIRMEHGIGQSFVGSRHPSYAGGQDAGDVGLFLVPNAHSARRWQEAYPKAAVEVVGCPKLDQLPRRHGKPGRVVAVSFHWGQAISPGAALLETNGSWTEYKHSIAHLALHEHVIGHGHPRAIDQMVRTYIRAGVKVVRDFEDVCRQADLYVCDTNSTIYEFASTGRPVVVVNGSHFRREVHHGLRFWDAASVGVNCDDPGELLRAIDEAFRDSARQKAAREAALDMVYAFRTGAAKRAADAILAWVGGARSAAA